MSVLKKREVKSSSSGAAGSPEADQLSSALTGLWEMLCSTRYPDGSPRASSTLLVFVESGQVKACLNDRDQGMSAWVTASSLWGALAALESGIQGDSLDWRVPSQSKQKKR